MRRFFKCVQFLSVVAVLVATFYINPDKVAASEKSWVGNSVVKLHEAAAAWPTSLMSSCSGVAGLISVHGWNGLQEACIYGSAGGVQIAKYGGSSGGLYAIAFALDTTFTQLRHPCPYSSACAYGQAADTLMVLVQKQNGSELALIDDFSKNLVKHTDDGTYYTYEGDQDWKYVSLGSRGAKAGSMAVSLSGKWGVVEIRSYGFVRINLETLEYKRVVAASGEYGYGFNPGYDLTLSNDGSKLAVAGLNTSIAVYEIDDECGDVLTDTSTRYFSPYTYACKMASVDVYGLFPGFRTAQSPRFSESGARLSLYVNANNKNSFASIGPEASKELEEPLYVAFGDSFTSGEGETSDIFYVPSTNTPQNKCHVSTRSYPYLTGVLWDIKTENKACSGGRIDDVKVAAKNTHPPSLVTIGVGGNDIELMGKLKTCLGPGQCDWVSSDKRRSGAEEIKAVFDRIVELVGSLKLEYPGTQLAVVGYPSVVNTGADARCGLLIATLLNTEERRYMDESIKYLNKVLKAAAHATSTPYIDIEDALVGKRLCDPSEEAMNSVRFGDDIAPLSFLSDFKLLGRESFHPTPLGHQFIASIIQSRHSTWQDVICSECQFDPSGLAFTGYWAEGDTQANDGYRQKALEFLAKTESKNGDTISFNFQKGTFSAGSRVRLEIHSEVMGLGEYLAAADGSLKGEVTIPEGLEGYHTIHAYGMSQSDNKYDLYQTVVIGNVTPEGVVSKSTPTNFGSNPIRSKARGAQQSTQQSAVLGDSTIAKSGSNNPPTKDRPDAPGRQEGIVASFLVLGGLLLTGLAVWWLLHWRNKRTSG